MNNDTTTAKSRPKARLAAQEGPGIECTGCGYTGRVLEAHHGYKWWMLPLGFMLACTGLGVIPLALILIPLGNRTFRACPQCGNRELESWKGKPSPESEAIWKQASEADEKAFKKTKLVLFSVVMALLAAALVFLFIMMRKP